MGLRHVAGLLLGPLIAAFGGGPCAAKESAAPCFELRPGVVVDGKAVYVSSSVRDGIEALDPVTGIARWRSDRAVLPLLVHRGRLIAQAKSTAPSLAIVSLDVTNPDKDPKIASLALASGVQPLVDDGLGTTFRVSAFGHGQRVIVHWVYTKRTVSGLPQRNAQPTVVEGDTAFDPVTGALKGFTGAPPSHPMANPPASVRAANTALDHPFAPAGNVWIHVSRRTVQGTKRIEVMRWTGGGGVLPARSFSVKDWLVEAVSRDGRHLAAVTRRAGGRMFVDDYRWTLFDLVAGHPVVSYPAPSSATPFAVIGDMVVRIAAAQAVREGEKLVRKPLRLEGRSLDGKATWWHAIRDTRYRGPMPPTRRR